MDKKISKDSMMTNSINENTYKTFQQSLQPLRDLIYFYIRHKMKGICCLSVLQ